MRRFLALALVVAIGAAGAVAYYRLGSSSQESGLAPVGQSQALEAVVSPGEGLVARHPLGAQLRVLPHTFDRPTRVRVAPEEVVPLSHALAAPVWSLEAEEAQFSRPIDLVLSLLPEARSAEPTDIFAVYWDGNHWVRTPGSARADGEGVHVQATHFSLWSVGQDPITHSDDEEAAPSILALSAPDRVRAGEELEIGYAVANLGATDLEGYGVVTAVLTGGFGARESSTGPVEGWDGSDGPLGSIAYVAGMELGQTVKAITTVDTQTLAPLRIRADTAGPARLQIRLDFYDPSGGALSSVVAETAIDVEPGEAAEDATPEPTAVPRLPERIEVVREPGAPLALASAGTVTEDFDAPGTFTGAPGRDVARGWGAYQSGVVAQFAASSEGMEGSQAQSLLGRGATRLGIVRGVAGLRPGEAYQLSVQYWLQRPVGSEAGQRVRLGVDPTGGTDPTSVSVLWAEGAVEGSWATLLLPDVRPEGDSITVFLEATDPDGSGGLIACLDILEVRAEWAQPMPDLIVESLWTEVPALGVCDGSTARLLVQVRNRGGGRAPSFDTVVGGTDGACGPWRVRGLEPGEAFVFACELSDPGGRTIRVITDPSNSIGESNENNNWLEQEVMVPACLPTATPVVVPSPTAVVTPAPTATPTLVPTPTPPAIGCRQDGAPLCLGSVVQFRYLDSDWTLSLEGWTREPDGDDPRWVKVLAWGTITRERRHDVERLLTTTGDADLGRILSLTLVDDHGHSHVATGARIEGPLSVPARLQFEDCRNLWGRFYFEVPGFPSPSPVSGATVQVGLAPLSTDGKLLQFLYLPGEEGEQPRRTPTATPSLPPGVLIQEKAVEAMPYLSMSANAKMAADGRLLTIEFSFRNDDYVALRPDLGRALVINSDWLYGAYLGLDPNQPVNWRQADATWQDLTEKGIPPLTGKNADPYVITVYALAPAQQGPWQDPVLWLPRLDVALQLEFG